MFVVTALPEDFPVQVFEIVGGTLFEVIYKFYQVAGIGQGLYQEMEMVGHHAVGVELEVMLADAG